MAASKGTCCVIGGTGFVGSYITRELLNRGYAVRATCRDPSKAEWLKQLVPGAPLTLHALTMKPEGFPADASPLDELVRGCTGAFMCSGYEAQEPSTIDFMGNAAQGVLRAATKNSERTCVVLTSSTGSTNPPGAAPDALKNELDTWSDPEVQQKNGRFSPAAKTLMEINALKYVGRNQRNEVVDQAAADGQGKNIRLCILNPSLILGPQLQPGDVTGNGLPFFCGIAKGEKMAEQIPNDSMSIIHVEDLARLHVACMELDSASGRYFGVNQSWPWETIMQEMQKVYPPFKLPPKQYETANPATRFDNTRRDTLGVQLKSLGEILSDTLNFLKLKGHLA